MSSNPGSLDGIPPRGGIIVRRRRRRRLLLLRASTLRLDQHHPHHGLFLNDLPQALNQHAASFAELAFPEAVQDAAEDLPRDAALGGERRAAQDGYLGDGVAGGLRVVAVMVQAQGGWQGEGGAWGEDGAEEGEADGGWVDGFGGAGGGVGRCSGGVWVGVRVRRGLLEPGEGGGVVGGIGEVVRLEVVEEGGRGWIEGGDGVVGGRLWWCWEVEGGQFGGGTEVVGQRGRWEVVVNWSGLLFGGLWSG